MEAQKRQSSSSSSTGDNSLVDAGILAARALYVMEVTRNEPRWADWDSEVDNSQASPQVSTVWDVLH